MKRVARTAEAIARQAGYIEGVRAQYAVDHQVINDLRQQVAELRQHLIDAAAAVYQGEKAGTT